jgi:asparagine synthase (glutamine-hydrolysing)
LGVLLTGQLGNAVISWTGTRENLLPILLDGDFSGFWRAFQNASRGAGLGYWRGVRRFLLKPLADPLRYQFNKRWPPSRNAWQEFSAVRPDFAREIKLGQQMADAGFILGTQPPDPLQQRLRIIKPGRSIVGASWFDIGASYGVEVRDPTQDRRVIELCLSIPEDQYQHGGVNRWLIRRAMQGYLPDEVRLNTLRGLQAADLGQRVLENRDDFEAAFVKMEKHDLTSQVIDIPKMKELIASLQHSLTPQNTLECGSVLMNGVMAGSFLLRY